MNAILSPKWWISTMISTLITIFFIYILKQITAKVQIPVVSDVVQQA